MTGGRTIRPAMLFKTAILDRIARGEVTLAFRRWRKPGLRPGSRLRTAAGVLLIERVDPVDDVGQDDAIAAGYPDRAVLLADLRAEGTLYRIALRRDGCDPREALRRRDDLDGLEALERWPWAWPVLRLIAARSGVAAAELATALDMDRPALKLKIRKLKELGLTESLTVGYRLSPRGLKLLDAANSAGRSAAGIVSGR